MSERPAARRWSLWVSSSLALVALGCGGARGLVTNFEGGWQWDEGQEALHVQELLLGKTAAERVPAAVGVTGHGLVGRTLPDGKSWTYEGEVNVLPSLVGDVVAFTGNNKVTLLDVRTGQRRWQIDAQGRRLEGFGYDGESAVLLLVDEDDARADQVQIVSRHGQTRASATTLERVGTPAAVGGLGLVPWSAQYVSVFDLKDGQRLGRVLVRDAIHRIEAHQDGVFVYGRGVARLTPELAKTPELPSLRAPRLDFPGEPAWPVDGSKPRPAKARPIGLYAYPTRASGRFSFVGDALFGTYYDVVLGLDSSGGAVRWVNHFERSVVGADAGPGGFAACLEDGSLWQIEPGSGSVEPWGALESRLRACVITAPERAPRALERPGIEEQIHRTIAGTGPDMAAIHAFLVDDLGRRSGDAATTALLAIAQDPLTSASVIERASVALERRSSGADALIRALVDSAPPPPRGEPGATPAAPRGSTPEGTPDRAPGEPRRPPRRAPPLGALARALTRMEDKRAATPLALHLNAPAITSAEALALLEAVLLLGGAEEVPLVLEFFATYRTTGGDPDFVEALALAGQFVFTHGAEEEKARVRAAATDTLTHPDLRRSLARRLEPR